VGAGLEGTAERSREEEVQAATTRRIAARVSKAGPGLRRVGSLLEGGFDIDSVAWSVISLTDIEGEG
jgi:hypothetical protein